MKKKLSVLVSGVALMALFAAPVSALVSGEEEASKVNLSCLVGAGVEEDVAKAHLVDVLNVAEEAVVYDEEGNSVDKKFLKDAYHVFNVGGENVLVHKKTLKLYNYDANYNLIPVR